MTPRMTADAACDLIRQHGAERTPDGLRCVVCQHAAPCPTARLAASYVELLQAISDRAAGTSCDRGQEGGCRTCPGCRAAAAYGREVAA